MLLPHFFSNAHGFLPFTRFPFGYFSLGPPLLIIIIFIISLCHLFRLLLEYKLQFNPHANLLLLPLFSRLLFCDVLYETRRPESPGCFA